MLGVNTDLHSKGTSAEDSMRFNVVFPFSRDRYDQSLYQEAAKRVVFKNCMDVCELSHEDVPNFNKKFYNAMEGAKECLQTCVNDRMTAHFGAKNAEKHNMLYDFDEMKKEYKNYELWLPKNRYFAEYQRGFEEANI